MSSSTSSSKAAQRFAIRCLLFCVPMLALFIPLEIFLWRTGESRSASSVIEVQANSDDEVLYGRGLLNQQFNVYKLAGWKKHQPKIVAVGSSRVWRLRKFAFHPREDDFYNAGGILQCVDDLRRLSEMIAAGELNKPKAILIGFDPWWFKTNHRDVTWLDGPSLREDGYRLASRRNVLKRIWSDPSILRSQPVERQIGIYGSIGFRFDGTMKMPIETIEEFRANPIYVDRESPPIIERIRERSGRFSDSKPSSDRLQTSLDAVELLRAQGVRVIAYFPPFAEESWTAIQESPSIMAWMSFYMEEVVPAVTAASNEVIVLCDSKEFGVDDTYFKDGMHPGEVFAALQWLELVDREQSKVFYRQFAPNYVREQIAERCSTPLAFDD